MKTLLLTLAALLGPLVPAIAAGGAPSYAPKTYVSVATFTAAGNGTNAFAFQNVSAGEDVRVLKVELTSVTSGTVTSGLMQFWLMGSTVVTAGSTGAVSLYDYATPNAAAPASISASVAPTGVVYEGKQGGQLPFDRALIVNPDETATSNFRDELSFTAPADGAEFILPHGSNRAVVLLQKQFGTTDFSAGTLMVRVLYTVK